MKERKRSKAGIDELLRLPVHTGVETREEEIDDAVYGRDKSRRKPPSNF